MRVQIRYSNPWENCDEDVRWYNNVSYFLDGILKKIEKKRNWENSDFFSENEFLKLIFKKCPKLICFWNFKNSEKKIIFFFDSKTINVPFFLVQKIQKKNFFFQFQIHKVSAKRFHTDFAIFHKQFQNKKIYKKLINDNLNIKELLRFILFYFFFCFKRWRIIFWIFEN